MDHRTHERGIGMLNTPYVKKDTIKNFFPVPNAVFDLGLHHMEINIYAYLLRIEDRRTYRNTTMRSVRSWQHRLYHKKAAMYCKRDLQYIAVYDARFELCI